MNQTVKVETHSDTWRAVKACADKGLESARSKLEQHGNPIDVTEFERGKIKAFREILELGLVQKAIPSVDPQY